EHDQPVGQGGWRSPSFRGVAVGVCALARVPPPASLAATRGGEPAIGAEPEYQDQCVVLPVYLGEPVAASPVAHHADYVDGPEGGSLVVATRRAWRQPVQPFPRCQLPLAGVAEPVQGVCRRYRFYCLRGISLRRNRAAPAGRFAAQ